MFLFLYRFFHKRSYGCFFILRMKEHVYHYQANITFDDGKEFSNERDKFIVPSRMK